MKYRITSLLVLLMFFSVLVHTGFSEDASEPKTSPIEPEAMSILMNMTQNLSTKEKFKMKIKSG